MPSRLTLAALALAATAAVGATAYVAQEAAPVVTAPASVLDSGERDAEHFGRPPVGNGHVIDLDLPVTPDEAPLPAPSPYVVAPPAAPSSSPAPAPATPVVVEDQGVDPAPAPPASTPDEELPTSGQPMPCDRPDYARPDNCEATPQRPEERIGRELEGPNGEACVVVAIAEDGTDVVECQPPTTDTPEA